MNDRLLVLVRHGESDWNKKNLFTGWRDIDLSEKGVKEAREAGRKLKAQGLKFDVAFTSALIRAQRTLDLMLEELGQTGIPVFKDQALNERDYGDLSGLNKDDARKKWGEEQVHIWRRSYATAPPGGEFLRDTAARVLPYYIQEILPRVMRGEHVLVSAHGNSLRALVMVLDRHTTETITKLILDTGVPMIYRLNADSTVESKLIWRHKSALRKTSGLSFGSEGPGPFNQALRRYGIVPADRYRRSTGNGSRCRSGVPRHGRIFGIADEGFGCGRRGELHNRDQRGVQRLTLQRLHVAASRQILAAVLVHEFMDRSRIGRHPLSSVNLMSRSGKRPLSLSPVLVCAAGLPGDAAAAWQETPARSSPETGPGGTVSVLVA